MQRHALQQLTSWLTSPQRRPLVLRGARQVGKTWLVRELARSERRDLVEVNFERDPTMARHFASNDPRRIVGELQLALGREISATRSLLFLDEIQAADEVLGKLRWFAEEAPDLPVVAAGSLLDFALRDHALSMPVGRISYLNIEPMGFAEYLQANAQHMLLQTLMAWKPGEAFSPAAHDQATHWFDRYTMVGGMPAVVHADLERHDPRECRRLQQDLVATFRDDFAKYSSQATRGLLDSVLLAVAASVGQKFVYARVADGVKTHQTKAALELLALARVCHIVRYATAAGLPLGGDTKDTFRRVILADVGLLHAAIGTPASSVFPSLDSLSSQVRDQLAQQLAAQQLRWMLAADGAAPELYYWQREGGRSGEIDYLVQTEGRILPTEIKAGAAGAMKGLHQFMFEKRLALAVRIDANSPSVQEMDVRTTQGDPVRYRLLNLPHYLAWRLNAALSVL